MNFIKTALNPRQIEAVTSTEGYLRVVAGAGSGKTKALTHRYAYLVKAAGIQPRNILSVTFTSKAAGEMRRRVRQLIGDGYDTSLITTYHGFCVRVLREDIEKLFYPRNFLILDISDQKKILEEIYDELELKLDYASFQKLLNKIDRKKADIDYLDQIVDPNYMIKQEAESMDDKIFKMYLQRQKKVFGLDFNDLINFTFYLFSHHEDVMKNWRDQLHYIQVDEFQDSSDREMHLLEILSGTNENMFVVGDPDQNIYEWRGAKIEILVGFDKRHPDTKTIVMTQNYRSTPQILNVANSLIDKNLLRFKKSLFTENPIGDSVIHVHSSDEKAEAKWIVDEIKNVMAKQHRKYSDFALLYRASFLSRYLEQALLEKDIPYRIWGGIRFYERMEIRDTIAYLRMVAYQDDLSFLRIINVPRRKMGKTRTSYLRSCAEEERTNMYSALKNHIDDEQFAGTGAKGFVKLIENFRNKPCAPSELMHAILEESGYEQYIRELGDEERLDNLAELRKAITEYERTYGEELPLDDYLNYIALRYDEDDLEENQDHVRLMTIHASKGLEFPCVFVTGMTEGIIPSSRTIEERKLEGLEEERRLCFVAITRARERLYFTDSEGFGFKGDKKLPSRFLFDIDEGLYERIGTISQNLVDELRRKTYSTQYIKNVNAIAVGEKVEHAVFGNGTIQSLDLAKGVYNIHFEKLEKIKPIGMDYGFSPKPILLLEQTDDKSAPESQIAFNGFVRDDDNEDDVIDIDPKPFDEDETAKEMESESIIAFEERTGSEIEYSVSTKALTIDTAETNLWKRADVPHSGWLCVGFYDLGKPIGICEMCGYQIIRYVHVMNHPEFPGDIRAGRVCAGRMAGNPEEALKREQDHINMQKRRSYFIQRKWKKSKKGNMYLNFMDINIVLVPDKYHEGFWKYMIDGKISHAYISIEEAKLGAFDAVAKQRGLR